MSEAGEPIQPIEPILPVEPVLASIPQRIGGALLDGVLTSMVIVIPLLLGFVKFDDLQRQLPVSTGWAVVVAVFGAAYTIIPTALWGQTAGKLAVGTRVVSDVDGSVPGWRRSGIRWLVSEGIGRLPYLGIWVSVVVLGSLLLDPRRRGLHDKAAGTVVVRVSAR